jgi:hypothetical protein
MIRGEMAAAVVVVALVSAAAGCTSGGSDDQSRLGSPATAPGSAAAASTTTPANAADGDAQFCALAKARGAANLSVFDSSSTTPDQVRQVVRNIDDMAAAAPPVIHDDFALFDQFERRLLAENETPDPALDQEAGGQELRDALTHLATYLTQTCGIEMYTG